MSPSRRFDITIEPIEDIFTRRYTCAVSVYGTLREMRRAARRYHPEAGELLADAGGAFQISRNLWGRGNRLGVMRLSEEALTPWTVMHEAVHVGVALAFNECNRGRVGNGLSPEPIGLEPYLAGAWAVREELIAHGAHAFGFGVLAELGLIDHPTEETGAPHADTNP